MYTKKILFSLLCLACTALAGRAGAQCTTFSGTVATNSYNVCQNVVFNVPVTSNLVLDSNDVRRFVIHTGTGNQIGTILGTYTSTTLYPLPPAGMYQVAAVAGNSNGAGGIDWNDPCLSVNGGLILNILPTPQVSIVPPPTLSCSSPLVPLVGSIDYAFPTVFDWYGPVSNPNILSTTASLPGEYVLFAIDPTSGCYGADTAYVLQDGTYPTVDITSNIIPCDGTGGPATITANASGNGPITYLWHTGETTQSILAPVPPNGATTYCVTVTNNDGCTATDCIIVYPMNPLNLTFEYSSGLFCFDSSYLLVLVNGNQPFLYNVDWSDGSQSSLIQNPGAGNYSVTVTFPNTGCTATASYFLDIDPTACATLQGHILGDYNTNCTTESSDIGLNGFVLRIQDATGNEFFTSSHADGSYSISVFPGAYTVSVILPNNLWSPCQPSYNITVGPAGTVTLDYLLQPLALCPAMTVDLGNPWLRRCFNGQYWIVYNNKGTEAATDAYVEIQFDPYLTPLSSSLPYTDLGNNLFRFDLGNVQANGYGAFWVSVNVSCDATPGQTHCSTATIYPTGTCIPDNPPGVWSGASLQITADCASDSLRFHLKNVGVAPMSGALEYVVIEDAVMLMSAPPPVILLAPNEERLVAVPANGSTWRVEAVQEPFHPGNSMPSLAVEGCTPGQSFSTGFVNQFPMDDADPWIDEDCTPNMGSYDPNDKQGFPLGYNAEHYINRGTDIEYLIRFQNTGTDTAFTVIIRDTLAPWLDPGTVVPGASSHPYRFDYYGGGNLKFVFDDIKLPDSSANLAASQGFVSFRVSQRADVPYETDILNRAGIFFDFNEPVYTNTTQHRVGHNFVLVDTWTPLAAGMNLQVMPNPTTETAILQLDGLRNDAIWQVELTDLTGKVVRRAEVSGSQWRFERAGLPDGMYVVRVATDGRLLGTGKLVIE